MSVIPPVLFVLTAIAAIALMFRSVQAALPGIRLMRQQLGDGSTDLVVTSATLDLRLPVPAAMESTRPPRLHRRGAHPKPVTHRLHHYPRPAFSAA